MDLKKTIKNLSTTPGVYIYKNKNKKIIYIGKAINLKNRVNQYFSRPDALGPKTQALVSQIASITTKNVGSEIEALILEASFIKKYRPKYNSQLKDDKNYLYICITKHKLPQVFSAHLNKLPSNAFIYGPFPSGSAVKSILKTIRRLFPFYSRPHSKKRCLYCHLGLCPGPSPNPASYRQNIGNIKKILSGNFKKLQTQLKKDIKASTAKQDFESAIIFRNQLQALNYIVSGWHNLSDLFSSVNLASDTTNSATQNLVSLLQPYFPRLKKIERIEGYDISQMGSRHFVAAMSVFQQGRLDHSQYRQFKIKTLSTADDPQMMAEEISRRLKHDAWPLPDLILVDGGKPQAKAASAAVLSERSSAKDLPIPLIGLAKKEETIIIKTNKRWQKINLPKNSHSLLLLQNLRNEAHRFANRYRKKLIKKSLN